jgi:hypothetical protein
MDVASITARARELFPDAAISVVHVSKRDIATGKKTEHVAVEASDVSYTFTSMADATRALILLVALGKDGVEHTHVPVAPTPIAQDVVAQEPPAAEAPPSAEALSQPLPPAAQSGGQPDRVQVAGRAPTLSI